MVEENVPKIQSIKLNLLMNAILRTSAFIFPLITFPYISRVLGASGNGAVTFAESIVNYFLIFAQLGIPTYGIKKCAECRHDTKKLNRTVQELLIINISTVIVSYIALIVMVLIVPRLIEYRVLILISSISILLNACGMDWLFQALEQYSYITFRNLGFKFLSIILMFIFIHSPENYVILGAINVVGNYGSNILNLLYARRFLSFKPMGEYNFRQHVKPILVFFLLSVSITIYTSLDSVMLGFMSTTAAVGFFAAGTKMKVILTSAVSAIGNVMLPRMSDYVANGRINDFHRMVRKSLNLVLLITTPLTIYFFVMSDATIDFLAGKGYAPAIVPMRILSFTVIIIGITNVLGLQVLVPTNREKYVAISTIIGAGADFFVNLIFIPRLGASGAAWATLIAEFSVLIVQVVVLRHEINILIQDIKPFRIVFSGVIAFVVLLVLHTGFEGLSSFLQLLITAPVFFFSYCVSLFIFKEPFTQIYLQQLITQINKSRRLNNLSNKNMKR
ncbi:transporter [Bifidobacterium eulemuris]|uniref:Transporter n=1 Tax=Bifidobacterium eulemuris TaxID=1765219 RepID=A0A261GAU6_9BIFI|nr:flippase [Bifidobacterium eulemuris]OZG68534.1 transporter [Bifidobacterium eulemuris]